MPKKPTVTVTIETPVKEKKKRPAPRSAFKCGNPYRFTSSSNGSKKSGNPAGRPPDEMRLVSRALKAQLGHRAPDAVASALNLTPGASWAMCVAQSLIQLGVRGDISAIREIRESTEGTRSKVEFTDAQGDPLGIPQLQINLVGPLQKDSGLQTSWEAPTLDAKTQ